MLCKCIQLFTAVPSGNSFGIVLLPLLCFPHSYLFLFCSVFRIPALVGSSISSRHSLRILGDASKLLWDDSEPDEDARLNHHYCIHWHCNERDSCGILAGHFGDSLKDLGAGNVMNKLCALASLSYLDCADWSAIESTSVSRKRFFSLDSFRFFQFLHWFVSSFVCSFLHLFVSFFICMFLSLFVCLLFCENYRRAKQKWFKVV